MDLLVENAGRINYASLLDSRKGTINYTVARPEIFTKWLSNLFSHIEILGLEVSSQTVLILLCWADHVSVM